MALDYLVIGQRIKDARKRKNLTQESLAEKLDVSIAFLSRIERGSSHLNLKRLSQLCAELDITEGEVLNGTSNSSKTYLNHEFSRLLENCPASKQKLIYSIAKIIVES